VITLSQNARRLVWPLTLFSWVVSGGNFVAFKLGAATLPPFTMISARLMISGCVLTAFSPLIDRDVAAAADPIGARQARLMVLAGFLTFALGQGVVVWGVARTGASVGSVLAASSPVFLGLFAWTIGQQTLSGRQWVGVAAGFIGCASLIASRSNEGNAIDPISAVALLAGPAGFAAGLLMQRQAALPRRKFLAIGLQMVAAAVMLLCLGAATGELSGLDVSEVSASSWWAFAFITIPGSLLVFAAIVWLARMASPAIANSFAYASPAIAILLSWLILSEPITLGLLASAALALGGAALMVDQKNKAAALTE
jgi:drug/metabolite transporter (DMT)-like permease